MEELLRLIGGRWKVIILWHVMDGPQRFNELRRRMPGVTQKVFTQQLRDLQHDGFLTRKVFAQVPVRVEYSATPLARSLRPVLRAMHDWTVENGGALRKSARGGTARRRAVAAAPAEG